jgi:hypothetical protein
MTLFDELHRNALADNDLLFKNDAEGDVFTISRNVDFAFRTNDKENADDLCAYINGKNFGKASVTRADDGLYWVIVVIQMPITQNLVCSVSAFMVCLGRLFRVEYDGWGSVVQTA